MLFWMIKRTQGGRCAPQVRDDHVNQPDLAGQPGEACY